MVPYLDSCIALLYSSSVIRDFRHKGLDRFFNTGNTSGIKTMHARRLSLQLGALDAAIDPKGMNMPGRTITKVTYHEQNA